MRVRTGRIKILQRCTGHLPWADVRCPSCVMYGTAAVNYRVSSQLLIVLNQGDGDAAFHFGQVVKFN